MTTISISARARLTQGYRITTPVSHEFECRAVTPPSGAPEVFTIGSSGAVTAFLRSETAPGGFSQVDLGGSMQKIRVTPQVDGRYLLCGLSQTQDGDQSLCFKRAHADGWDRHWQTPVSLSYNNSTDIDMALVDGKVVVASFNPSIELGYYVISGPDDPLSGTWYYVWNAQEPTVPWGGVQILPSTDGLSPTLLTAYQTCLYLFPGTRVAAGATAVTMAASMWPDASIDLVMTQNLSYPSPASSGQLLAASWGPGGVGPVSGWATWSADVEARSYAATEMTAGSGALELFLLDAATRQLSHCTKPQEGASWTDPFVLGEKQYAQISAAANGEGDPEVFAVGLDGSLDHWKRSPDTGDWQVSSIEQVSSGAVEPFDCYEAVITAVDDRGVPCSWAPVSITTSGVATMVIAGRSRYVDAQTPATATLDAAGQITVQVATRTLAVPELTATVDIGGDTAIARIELNASVQDHLHRTDAGELEKQLGLAPEQGEPVASALRKIAGLGKPPPAAPGAWSLRFDGDRVTFAELPDDEAARRRDAALARPRFDGTLDLAAAWGDLWSAVQRGVARVHEMVVQPVLDAAGTLVQSLNATFTVMIDGVAHGLAAVVDVAERLFDLVEGVFNHVAIGFQKLFRWLAFVYDWSDIVRTRDAMAYTVDQGLGFLVGAAQALRPRIDQGFDGFQAEIDQFLRGASAMLGRLSLGGLRGDAGTLPPGTGAFSGPNVVLDAITSGLRSLAPDQLAALASTALARTDDDPTGPFFDRVTALVAQAAPALAQARTYFENLGGDVDRILGRSLAGLVSLAQAVVDVALSGVHAVIDAMLDLVSWVAGKIRALFATRLSFPLLGPLYELVTGRQVPEGPTLLEALTLAAAIPATALTKVACGVAPFPDDASVATFKGSFDAASLLRAADFGGAALGDGAAPGIPPQWLTRSQTLTMGAYPNCALLIYAGFTAAIDQSLSKSPRALSVVAFLMETIAAATSAPWITDPGPVNLSPAGSLRLVWLYTAGGWLLDAIYLFTEGRVPEAVSETGVWISELYGLGHAIFAAVASAGQRPLVLANLWLPVIPESAKVLRSEALVDASGKRSPGLLAVLDVLGFGGAAATGITLAWPGHATAPAT